MIDFSAPRYAGSGFGLVQFTAQVKVGGLTSFKVIHRRIAEYEGLRRPVVPYLTNLGGDSPATVAERIEKSAHLPLGKRWYTEAEWRALRADGEPRG